MHWWEAVIPILVSSYLEHSAHLEESGDVISVYETPGDCAKQI